MQVRFLTRLSLLSLLLTMPLLITSTSQSLLCSSVLAAEGKSWGESGRRGNAGRKGENGRMSDNLTVFADGSPMTLDLSGGEGSPGAPGMAGRDAQCSQPKELLGKNLRGANGGNGGNGGDGGAGGNGGSLTIYTTNKEYLQQIYVIAAGGEGGSSGKGGVGGAGCECDRPYWIEETCSGEPGDSEYSCTTKEFQCVDGYSGRKGREGRNGRDGKIGTLTLINLDKTLAPDFPEVTAPIGQLKERGFTLSRNIWRNGDNATALLAPGSIIANKYKELVARHEHSVLIVWDAPQPLEQFEERQITMSLKGQNDANIVLPDDLWLETKKVKRDSLTELFIFNAVKTKDVADLKLGRISGRGADLELNVIDQGEKSSIIATDFSVKYSVKESSDKKGLFGGNRRQYQTKYEGSIPPEAIALENNSFTLRLGQLPIAAEDLQPGLKVEVELIAKRSLGENSQVKKLTKRTRIE